MNDSLQDSFYLEKHS